LPRGLRKRNASNLTRMHEPNHKNKSNKTKLTVTGQSEGMPKTIAVGGAVEGRNAPSYKFPYGRGGKTGMQETVSGCSNMVGYGNGRWENAGRMKDAGGK